MLLKRNLLETVTIVSCSGTLICILLNYVTNISPLKGIWFPTYTLVLFFFSATFSFKFIQWLLHLNKPLKYDIDGFVKNYPYLEFLSRVFPRVPERAVRECLEYDTNELSVISTVLERKLVSSWYTQYVSPEIGFPFACKQILDQMIGKMFQICNKIETKDVYIDICSVLITHLKEYKKAIKRHEKSPNQSIESIYKMSHQTFESKETAEHCTNLLRIIMKELIPWELWDTPHSELLVRILSKKLDQYIDSTLADPVWLNDKLMTILKGKQSQTVAKDKEFYTGIIQTDIEPEAPKQIITEPPKEPDLKVEAQKKPETTIESALSVLVANTTAPILSNALNEDLGNTDVEIIDTTAEEAINGSKPVDINTSPVLRQRRGRQGRNEVKIYDRIIEGSVKTWETDTDLQCISLGQDLLAGLNGEITLSRLWGQEQDWEKQESRFWFGEEDQLELESDKEVSPVKKELSPKPADALLKDLQTTVHQAKTKIGDLQVPLVIDVPNNDEAAGMMEGLLDFGIAGLKKGLRFTGLSDEDKSPSHRESHKNDKLPFEPKHKTVEMKDSVIIQQREIGNSTVIQKEDNNGITAAPPLVKQQRVTSQDSVMTSLSKPTLTDKTSFPLPPLPLSDSPEPEYEEAADLSTSIAKLRCLLNQREESNSTSQGSKCEDIWWEGAEETRGRTQHRPSSRPVDTAAAADEYDMNAPEKNSPNQSSNNMQRLDRLFQRTVTGVFNSIKTAVGAERAEGVEPPPTRPLREWAYVCTEVELSVCGAVARLVGSRRAYSHVEAALDSLDQLPPAQPARAHEPDDFEEWCAVIGAGFTAGAELCAAGGLIHSHLAHRAATLLLADLAEAFITVYLEELTSWLRQQVFLAFERVDHEDTSKEEPLRPFCPEETCQTIMDRLPVLQVFGSETVRSAVDLAVSSCSHKQLNKDVIFRALDLYTIHFKKAAAVKYPSFDHN